MAGSAARVFRLPASLCWRLCSFVGAVAAHTFGWGHGFIAKAWSAATYFRNAVCLRNGGFRNSRGGIFRHGLSGWARLSRPVPGAAGDALGGFHCFT